jgi:hypothetical protein
MHDFPVMLKDVDDWIESWLQLDQVTIRSYYSGKSE